MLIIPIRIKTLEFDMKCNFWCFNNGNANLTEIYISTAQVQQGIGSTLTMHDGIMLPIVIVCHVVRHSRPAPVVLTLF